jgi:CubicO group peptidase (beta-lactamase class C family)
MKPPGGTPRSESHELSRAIERMLAAEIARDELPSASWLVARKGEVVSRGAIGSAVVEPERVPATTETIYDLASLTKPLVTTTLVLIAASEGRIGLDEPVRGEVPELAESTCLAEVTWTDLLAHRSGLEAWYPLYVEGNSRDRYLETIIARPAAYEPRTDAIYSDLGFILLFIAIERLMAAPFDEITRHRLLRPLGITRCAFNPAAGLTGSIAATDRDNAKERVLVSERGLSFDGWRHGVIRGEVNDGNACYVGGVAGHAGLFGDADSVAALASVYLPSRELLNEELRRMSIVCQAESRTERRGLGWQLRADENPASPLSGAAFGHTGFTGTSVWIDPAEELVIVLLTNRIHPVARDSRIQEIRRRLNEIVAVDYL